MNVRKVDLDRDYPTLSLFWTSKGLPAVPREYLPPHGVVAVEEGVLIAGAFLAYCDANLGSVGFIAGNPDATPELRGLGIEAVLCKLMVDAKTGGLTLLSAATNVPALQKRYEDLGFFKTDENVVHYARRI